MGDKTQYVKELEEKRRICNEKHIKNGVVIIDPKVTYIDEEHCFENKDSWQVIANMIEELE